MVAKTIESAGKNIKIKKRKPRVERFLKKIEPLLIENTKKVLILKGTHSCQTINDILRDMAMQSKPNAVVFNRKNPILPFEDVNSLEFLASKNDCSLVVLGSHSKKRPNNLVLGRMYDGHVLDLVEFGVEQFTSMESIPGPKKSITSKPMITFLGDQWESDSTYRKLENLFIDFFRGDKTDRLSLKGLDQLIVCTAIDSKVLIRIYSVQLRKSGTRIPLVGLVPMGPNFDMVVRRTQFASDDLLKLACKQPKNIKKPKVKNISETTLGEKVGRLHLERQNLDKMEGRKVAALRTKKRPAEAEAAVDTSEKTKTIKSPVAVAGGKPKRARKSFEHE
eukprot:gene1919-3727_t